VTIKPESVHFPVRASRSLILSAVTALVIPSIERVGVAWTDIIAAVLAVIGQGWVSLFHRKIWDADMEPLQIFFRRIVFLTIRYGDRMRASIDIGFSTMENN
jgi:hypothetical protein